MEGMVRGLDRLIEPFIGESIYYGLVADLFIRGGVDRDGNRVWNPEDDDIDKWIKGVTHFGYTASPLSYPQLKKDCMQQQQIKLLEEENIIYLKKC